MRRRRRLQRRDEARISASDPIGTEQAQAEQAQYRDVAYEQPRSLYRMYFSRPLYDTVHFLGYVPATIDAPRPREEATAYINASPRPQPPSRRISPVFELTDDEAEDRADAHKRRSR